MNKKLIAGILLVIIIVAVGIFLFKNQANPGAVSKNSISNSYTLSDVAQHMTVQSCWMVVGNNVYDVTSYINYHPDGKSILKGCGLDATQMYQKVKKHGGKANQLLSQYLIGKLED